MNSMLIVPFIFILCFGFSVASEESTNIVCDQEGFWDDWSEWSDCNDAVVIRRRSRKCLVKHLQSLNCDRYEVNCQADPSGYTENDLCSNAENEEESDIGFHKFENNLEKELKQIFPVSCNTWLFPRLCDTRHPLNNELQYRHGTEYTDVAQSKRQLEK
ncbi:hypothetical protein L596_030728 [Steinernema carpocapsae]|uniref:Uncharacterized protein n=1 Tax=Steinernema carpocapsae TaxID=34508 RepID=A0A4U5LNK4_STECR|nr:hypothetical protein L596_030728 [Steinernema carpocapsae]